MSKARKILVPIVLILGAIQFIPHQHPQAETVEADKFSTDNAEVQSILDKACMDCHSNETKYPWYGSIMPVNVWLDHHVEEGREHLNFSEWNAYSEGDRRHAIEETIEVVHEKEMPMLFYWLVHWDAKLTDAERATLVDFFKNYSSVATTTDLDEDDSLDEEDADGEYEDVDDDDEDEDEDDEEKEE